MMLLIASMFICYNLSFNFTIFFFCLLVIVHSCLSSSLLLINRRIVLFVFSRCGMKNKMFIYSIEGQRCILNKVNLCSKKGRENVYYMLYINDPNSEPRGEHKCNYDIRPGKSKVKKWSMTSHNALSCCSGNKSRVQDTAATMAIIVLLIIIDECEANRKNMNNIKKICSEFQVEHLWYDKVIC